ncbi:MAG TPA: PilZ domain-containing protein [Thermoanaerobaculia bacterium]|nr:PilZ domain-containing protein [Thermoanaerobaculia bacterium]
MSATIEVLPPPIALPGSDRRRFPRLRLNEPIRTVIGRGVGTLVDLSANGARIRHEAPVALGARVRVTFDWKGERFEATAEVLASRVASLGDATRFESRLRFLSVPERSQKILARTMTDALDDDLRKWVDNLHGWTDNAARADEARAEGTFIRCRYVYGRWQQTHTRDPLPPPDGFTVPVETDPAEIRTLCRTFEKSDEEGRSLVRLITGAVVKQ